MNADLLARATFVIDRSTSEQLTAVAAKLGVSRSALVRDVLAEPVELMHRWVSSLPPEPTPEAATALLERMGSEMEEWLDSKSAQLDLLKRDDNGHA